MALADEKYVRFTTYRRNGTPVASPVWWVPLDEGRFGFWTSSASGKAKRLANDPKVLVQPSDGRGKVKADTTPLPGTAALVEGGADFDAIKAKVKATYGFMTTLTRNLAKIAGFLKRKPVPDADRCVVVTLD